jgi:cytochrome c biogenesis protein CcmG, thiol:disulfide interchange protein DsbE
VPRTVRIALQAAAVAVLVALVALFAKGLVQNSTTVAAEMRDGQRPPAPGFTLPRLQGGGRVSLSAYRGKVVVLNFWASYCIACRAEAPVFAELLHRYGARGVAVIGVDSQDFASAGRRFAADYHIAYPLVHDSSNDVTTRWGVTSGLPVTFLINRAGKVQDYFPQEITAQQIDGAVSRLVGGQ